MDINIEMKLDRTVLRYEDASFLDVASNIGGFLFIVLSLIGILLGIWNYNNFDNHLASHLYKVKRNDPSTGKDAENNAQEAQTP